MKVANLKPLTNQAAPWKYDSMEATNFFFLGLAAWLVALFAPPLLALWFWRRATKRAWPWLVHLLLLPFTLAIEWVSVRAICFAAHDDGEGASGLGLLIILPFAMLLGSIIIYYAAVTWQIVSIAMRLTRRS